MKLIVFCFSAKSHSYFTDTMLFLFWGELLWSSVPFPEQDRVCYRSMTLRLNCINISLAYLILSISFSKQSWHVSFSSVWMTSIRSVWRIQTLCWSKALRCSTCGPPVRARGPRVSIWDLGFLSSPPILCVPAFLIQSQIDWCCNCIAVCPGNPSPSSLSPCLPVCLLHCSGELVHSSEEYWPYGHCQHVGGPATSACETRLPWSQQTPTQWQRPLVPWYDQW